jgi:hypothetical protein
MGSAAARARRLHLDAPASRRSSLYRLGHDLAENATRIARHGAPGVKQAAHHEEPGIRGGPPASPLDVHLPALRSSLPTTASQTSTHLARVSPFLLLLASPGSCPSSDAPCLSSRSGAPVPTFLRPSLAFAPASPPSLSSSRAPKMERVAQGLVGPYNLTSLGVPFTVHWVRLCVTTCAPKPC